MGLFVCQLVGSDQTKKCIRCFVSVSEERGGGMHSNAFLVLTLLMSGQKKPNPIIKKIVSDPISSVSLQLTVIVLLINVPVVV